MRVQKMATTSGGVDHSSLGSVFPHDHDSGRSASELELQEARDDLERRVAERTAELREANRQLQSQITVRKQAEQALRESEERFRRLADFGFEGIVVHEHGTILDANHSLVEMFACELGDLVGRNLSELLITESSEVLGDSLESDRGRPTALRGRRLDGTTFPAEIVSRALPYGRRSVWVTAIRDITENRRAEDERRRHEFELAQTARYYTVGEMATTLAHELNQPLTAITAYACGAILRLSSGTLTKDGLTGALQHVAAEALRAGEVIRSLRNFVRKREPECTTVHVNDLVREAVCLAEAEARYHGSSIRVDLADELPSVAADPIQIEQVILNLLRNGVEAMAKTAADERELLVRTARRGEDCVEIAVCDRGRGFDGQESVRIFQPFYSTRPQGMGMGLSISRSIVERHGGHLWAESQPGTGATFRFTLPIDGRNSDVEAETSSLCD